jgi:hypothetical protein
LGSYLDGGSRTRPDGAHHQGGGEHRPDHEAGDPTENCLPPKPQGAGLFMVEADFALDVLGDHPVGGADPARIDRGAQALRRALCGEQIR